MKKIQLSTVILSIAVMALSACSDSAASAVPKVSNTYQKKLDAAWETAGQGKSATMACTSVIGTAVGMTKAGQGEKSEAAQAYEACYVNVFVHYANALIAQPDNAVLGLRDQPVGCRTLFTQARVHQSALGGFAKDFDLDSNVLDAKIRAALDQGPVVACTNLFTPD